MEDELCQCMGEGCLALAFVPTCYTCIGRPAGGFMYVLVLSGLTVTTVICHQDECGNERGLLIGLIVWIGLCLFWCAMTALDSSEKGEITPAEAIAFHNILRRV